jgi:hypothetical protein
MTKNGLPIMLIAGVISGVCSGFVDYFRPYGRLIFPAIFLAVALSLPFRPFRRWWIPRFIGVIVASLIAHFILFGLMPSTSHPQAGAYAFVGAITGTAASLFFAIGFIFSFNPAAESRTIFVMALLGAVAGATASALLGFKTILTNQENVKYAMSFALWHGALGASLDKALAQTRNEYLGKLGRGSACRSEVAHPPIRQDTNRSPS